MLDQYQQNNIPKAWPPEEPAVINEVGGMLLQRACSEAYMVSDKT